MYVSCGAIVVGGCRCQDHDRATCSCMGKEVGGAKRLVESDTGRKCTRWVLKLPHRVQGRRRVEGEKIEWSVGITPVEIKRRIWASSEMQGRNRRGDGSRFVSERRTDGERRAFVQKVGKSLLRFGFSVEPCTCCATCGWNWLGLGTREAGAWGLPGAKVHQREEWMTWQTKLLWLAANVLDYIYNRHLART